MTSLILISTQMPIIWASLLALVGLFIGSFLNVVIYRLPRWLAAVDSASRARYSLWWPPSSCPGCGQRLRYRDLLPVLSWCWLRGRARCCAQPISWQYPGVESATALLFLMVGIAQPFGLGCASLLVFVSMLLALAVIDYQTQLLPDLLTLPLLWGGLLVNSQAVFVPLEEAVWGAAIGYLAFWTLKTVHYCFQGTEGLGGGDCKLFAALGAWLGWRALPGVALCAAATGIFVVLLLWSINARNVDERLPFGPALALAGVWGMANLILQ